MAETSSGTAISYTLKPISVLEPSAELNSALNLKAKPSVDVDLNFLAGIRISMPSFSLLTSLSIWNV